jgi:WD40 repeat protein
MKLILDRDHSLPTGVLGLAITPDGGRAFAACVDGSIQAVDLSTGEAQVFDGRHQSFASGCVLLPHGRTLISGGYDGMLLWHDVAKRTCWRRVRAHQFWNWRLALSPDGTRLATVTGQYLPGGWKYEPAAETEPTVKVFDTFTGDRVAAFRLAPPVLSCAFSPDGHRLAAANMMGDVCVWDLNWDGTSEQGDGGATKWNSPDFTSWGTVKTHHYCGGIYCLAFSPDGKSLLGCGMGPMRDPMAGNGKMTWQRWDGANGEKLDEIKEGQHGAGLMETLAWRPDGGYFVMAGRQAQGTWNAAIFAAADGNLAHSVDTKKRITQAMFTSDGALLVIGGATGQPSRNNGQWDSWGGLHVYRVDESDG